MKMKAFAHIHRRAILIATLAFSVAAITGIKPVWAAGITHSPTYPLVGQTVTFTGSCSYPPCDGYGWYFGDGTNGNGSPVNHAYSAAGTYSVHLVVGDANGNIENAYASVTVIGIYVVGHVYDNSNSAITGATIDLRTQDGNTLLGRTSTDSNGYYQIGGPNTGTFQVNASKAFYWEERQYVSVSCLGCTGTGDFHLPGDLFYPVANLVVEYAQVNTAETLATLSWTLSQGSQTTVDAYVAPLGGNFQVTTTATQAGCVSTGSGSTCPGTGDPTATSLLYQQAVEVHGIFWKQNPSNPTNIYVVPTQNSVTDEVTHTTDYMSCCPSSGGNLVNVAKKATYSATYTQSASFSLRYELGVDVSVTLEGVGFSTKLASILVQGSYNIQRSMTIQVTNLSKITHGYFFYFEGNSVLHVWQVN